MTGVFRLLLIEDDPDLRELIRITLEMTEGWEISTAASGADGLQAAHALSPDAVVVDLMMPEMDGYEVCRHLKADPRTAAIPLVLLTARKELEEQDIRSSGVMGVLRKPFDPDTLGNQILALCGRKRAQTGFARDA